MDASEHLYEKGIVYIKAKMWDEALECLEISSNGGNISAMYGIATVYERKGDANKAKEWYEKAAMSGHHNARMKLESSSKIEEKLGKDIENRFSKFQIISFGIYDWIIIDKTDDRFLLLSKNIIDIRQYNCECNNIAWGECDLRNWLNKDFFISFSKEEQDKIIETTNENVKDKIFCLSFQEIEKYFICGSHFSESDALIAYINMEKAMLKAAEKRTGLPYSTINGETLGWWLRDKGESEMSAMRVNCRGEIKRRGRLVDKNLVGVRPALWIWR